MVPCWVLDAKRIDLEISAVPRSFPYDVRLGGYALLVKEGPADKIAVIKSPEVHVSVHHLSDLPTCVRSPFEES